MKSTLREDIADQLKSSNLNFRTLDLEGLDLSDMDLTGADFRFSNLSYVNFSRSILKNANLSFAKIDHANFEGADVKGVNLQSASTEGVSWSVGQQKDTKVVTDKVQNLTQKLSSLTHLLYHTGWFGTVISVFIGAFMFYGVSAVIYFTNQILNAHEPTLGVFYQYIVANNIVGGILTVVATNWMSGFLEKNIKSITTQHLLLSFVIGVGYLFLTTFSFLSFGQEIIAETLKKYPSQSTSNAPWYVYVLCPIFVANVFHYFQKQGKQLTRKISEQELQLSELEKLKTRAELEALQARINPHFLYNSLNSIASLVHFDPDRAEQMTLLLSKLFRYVTNKTPDYFDTLANELEMAATYLEIEQVRFGDRLSFRILVSDEVLKQAQVPRFLIQPVVENAIKHGIAKMTERGAIEIKAAKKGRLLQITIHDNGTPFPEPVSVGYGLQSIQEKLRLLYGEEASVLLQNTPAKEVVITLPLMNK